MAPKETTLYLRFFQAGNTITSVKILEIPPKIVVRERIVSRPKVDILMNGQGGQDATIAQGKSSP